MQYLSAGNRPSDLIAFETNQCSKIEVVDVGVKTARQKRDLAGNITRNAPGEMGKDCHPLMESIAVKVYRGAGGVASREIS